MPTFDLATGLHDRVPADEERILRLELLQRKDLLADRPVPWFDSLAHDAAQEAADLVKKPDGFLAMVNLMKDGYQYFAGMWAPAGISGGESQATSADTPPEERFMERTSGWCVHTMDRRKALPLNNVFDYPRWLNKAIHQLGARTYLGTPLIHQPTGIALGTLCFVGRETTSWGRQEVALIKHYAAQALEHIDELPDNTQPPSEH
ncbi:GAF domain-containing protein [Streptomyces sp. ALI-76-A]|uniref:GAF domain-containing protein n=1 Tax=Streptomyces sp. ALI-76-A TaxID=3025736 RepID=UPI00256EDE73|nr:GAF domain-containing protein [Streptomyces sp. ALI-76-A]MDL5199775.1 GAF domain-containing protein [Streptomyces sp. ALI-76-A]